MKPRGSHRITISLPPDTGKALKARFTEKGALSAYVSDLIKRDLSGEIPLVSPELEKRIAAAVEEFAAPYEARLSKLEGKPPPKT